jgi:hypothetical protein
LWHCDVATPLSQLPDLFPELRILSVNDVHSQVAMGWSVPEQLVHLTRLQALRSLTWVTPRAALGQAQLALLQALPVLRDLVLAPGSDTSIADLQSLSGLVGLHKLELRMGLQHDRHRQLLVDKGWQPMLSALDRAMPRTMVTFTRDPADLTQ